MPEIRGRISREEFKVGHFTDAPEVLEFVNSRRSSIWRRSARRAPTISCAPRSARWSFRHGADATALDELIDAYRADYAAYYERCKHANSPAMRDPNAGDLSRSAASA